MNRRNRYVVNENYRLEADQYLSAQFGFILATSKYFSTTDRIIYINDIKFPNCPAMTVSF